MSLIAEFLRYFFLDFTRHLTLLAVLLLLGALVCARLGRSLGIDRLFWHEQRSLQRRAGASVGLLFAKIGFVGYLLDEEHLCTLAHFASEAPSERPLAAMLYIALLTLPTALIWALLARAARPWRASEAVPRGPFVLGALLALAFALGLLAAFDALVPLRPTLPAWLVRMLALEDVAPSARPLHVLAAVFMLLLSAEYVVYAITRRGFTPAMAVCTLLGLITGSVSFLEFRAWNESATVLALLGAVWVGGLPRYKLRIAALAGRYDSPAPLTCEPSSGGRSTPALIRSESVPWRVGERKPPLVLVCASGGGLRAALWSCEVLSELELSLPGFAQSLRIVAGASGGMLGASAYALTLRPRAKGSEGWSHVIEREALIARLGRDFLSTPIKRLVFRDLLLALLPVHNLKNRGDALESCWRRSLGEAFDARFGALVEHERRGELPSLVFTPMLVEDGRRLLISNLSLDFLAQNTVSPESDPHLLSLSGFQLAQLFPDEFARFPVATAARLSAAFPYVSPAVSLPTLPRRRVVDAGYYDNYGVNVCAGWLADCFCDSARRRWIEEHVSRILVVQVRDVVSPLHGLSIANPKRGPLARGLEGLLSPLHGVLSSRESVSAFRNDEQLEQVMRLYDLSFGRGFLRTEIFEYPGDASLSWYLTARERGAISEAARALAPTLDELRAFWRGEHPRTRPHGGLHVASPREPDAQIFG